MQVELTGKVLKVIRDENDAPIVKRPDDLRRAKNPKEYNSWRQYYILSFPTVQEATEAFKIVSEINDFDKAATWLDKQ